MSALRTLLELGGDSGALALKSIFVFHSSWDTTRDSNPGCCCLWTVPAETVWAGFEVWGAGGDGGGAVGSEVRPGQHDWTYETLFFA